MDWLRHRGVWPHAERSRFIPAGDSGQWHVQEMGDGPDVLLLHGAGGASQSWRNLMPLLAEHLRCISLDLPGQGFSIPERPGRYGLDAMAEDIAALAKAQSWKPVAVIGHSAGAALALRLWELGALSPGARLIAINGALGTFPGLAGIAFPLAAKMLALNPFTALFFSTAASAPNSAARILESTGSTIDEEGRLLYQRLISEGSHIDGTLRMMAAWDLEGILARLPTITAQSHLIVGENDQTVPPHVSEKAAARMPKAEVIALPGLGHLAHEEAAGTVATEILHALGGGLPASMRKAE